MQKKFKIEVDCANCAAKIEDAVKSMLKGVEKREFLVVPGVMANLIRLQLRFFPVSWVNWIGNKTVAFSLRK